MFIYLKTYFIMKKFHLFLVLFLISIFFATQAKADQLAWITKSQAKKAVKYLKKQKEVILFCGCCDNDTKDKVSISAVSYRHPTMGGEVQKDYYEVFITVYEDGQMKEISLDLAYVYVNKKQQAACLGLELGFECDPCSDPFAWSM
jgi:hypothetical protein